MPYKPIHRPFAPPPLRTPSFLPEPIYADSEIPEAEPGLQGPPPALQSPEVRINARVPERPKTTLEQYDEIESTRPKPLTGVRRGVSAFLRGGAPGLVSELIDPSAKYQQYDMDRKNVIERSKLKRDEEEHASDMDYRNASATAQRKHGDYYDSKANEKPQAYGVGSHGYVDTQGAFHDAEQRDPNPPANYEAHLVRVLNDPKAAPEAKMDAQKKLDALKPPPLGTPRNVSRGGTLVGPDGKVIYQDSRQPQGRPSAGGSDGGAGGPKSDEEIVAAINRGAMRLIDLPQKDRKRIGVLLEAPPPGNNGLSASDSKLQGIVQTLEPELEKLKQAFQQDYRGSILGIKSGTNRELSRLADQIADKVGRLRSGGAVNKQEEERFMRQLGGWADALPFISDPKSAIDALDGLLAESRTVRSSMKQPPKAQPGGAPPKVNTPAASAPVKMRGPNGKEAMVKPEKAAEAEKLGWKKVQQ